MVPLKPLAAAAAVLLSAAPASAFSWRFAPAGDFLDADAISDLEVQPGAGQNFNVLIDAGFFSDLGLGGQDLQEATFVWEWDGSELDLNTTDCGPDCSYGPVTALPNNFFRITANYGIEPDRTINGQGQFSVGQVKTTASVQLVNDGFFDLQGTIAEVVIDDQVYNSANGWNGQPEIPHTQVVEVQAPEGGLVAVPGPLGIPIIGGMFLWARKLRRRIREARA